MKKVIKNILLRILSLLLSFVLLFHCLIIIYDIIINDSSFEKLNYKVFIASVFWGIAMFITFIRGE